jgi:hypothetical protein
VAARGCQWYRAARLAQPMGCTAVNETSDMAAREAPEVRGRQLAGQEPPIRADIESARYRLFSAVSSVGGSTPDADGLRLEVV